MKKSSENHTHSVSEQKQGSSVLKKIQEIQKSKDQLLHQRGDKVVHEMKEKKLIK